MASSHIPQISRLKKRGQHLIQKELNFPKCSEFFGVKQTGVFVFPFSMLEKGSSTINACDFHWAGVQKLRYLLRNAHRIPAFHPIFTPALGASLGFLLGRAASRPLAVPCYESSGFPFSSISFSNWFPFALTFLEIY